MSDDKWPGMFVVLMILLVGFALALAHLGGTTP